MNDAVNTKLRDLVADGLRLWARLVAACLRGWEWTAGSVVRAWTWLAVSVVRAWTWMVVSIVRAWTWLVTGVVRAWTWMTAGIVRAWTWLVVRVVRIRVELADGPPMGKRLRTGMIQGRRVLVVGWRARRELLARLIASRSRIRAQLYGGIGAALAVTLVASLVAWFSFNRVGEAQSRVNEQSVPEMAAAFAIAQQTGDLVAAAPRLTAAATIAELARTTESIQKERQAFEYRLAALSGSDRRFDGVRQRGASLLANIDSIETLVADSFTLADRGQSIRAELALLQDELKHTLAPAVDDQFFYVTTGYRQLGSEAAPRSQYRSESELARYRHLAGLLEDATVGTEILASGFSLLDSALLVTLRDRFQATVGSVERSLTALGDAPVLLDVIPAFTRLRELGLGKESGFELRAQELALIDTQQALLTDNHELATQLVAEVEGLVSAARDSVAEASQVSGQIISTSRGLLLGLNLFAIIGAGLIAWLFIGRVLLRRIERLSNRMRAMADGDLEAEVEINGRDEVADMAGALEIFRRHALEVQRLNLVEKLAEELRGKNNQLETALIDLRQAQDQVVAREKLAALGGLTAGVAHEIKNPLNFVKNFSESSEELLEELRELLEEVGETLPDEQRDAVGEVCQELTDNLGRIRNHGDRADRIVRDMLMMGRDAGDKQLTDVNGLLEEHARLAFHSARAADPDFQLHIEQDLDSKVGDIEVIPQDLGRVFINVVSNACHAVDLRRKEAKKQDVDYLPTLRISSRRLDDRIEIVIWDNGSGIAPDILDKIFNPFFTTKPTDEGTGLGLALSNDIMREHGGTIRVNSEPGSFTEMTVELPL